MLAMFGASLLMTTSLMLSLFEFKMWQVSDKSFLSYLFIIYIFLGAVIKAFCNIFFTISGLSVVGQYHVIVGFILFIFVILGPVGIGMYVMAKSPLLKSNEIKKKR